MKDKCRISMRTCFQKRVPEKIFIYGSALATDVRHSWLSVAFEVLLSIIHGIMYGIIAGTAAFAAMDIPGN